MRDYEAEAKAKEVTELFRKHGGRDFRCEYDCNGAYWIQPSANGAILTTGKSPEAAAEAFAKAGAAMLRAAKGEQPAIAGLASTDWSGGRVFVSHGLSGFEVEHEPANGGRFGVHWDRTCKGALAAAEERAKRFGATVYVQHNTAAGY